jgi:hypothetical protein
MRSVRQELSSEAQWIGKAIMFEGLQARIR